MIRMIRTSSGHPAQYGGGGSSDQLPTVPRDRVFCGVFVVCRGVDSDAAVQRLNQHQLLATDERSSALTVEPQTQSAP